LGACCIPIDRDGLDVDIIVVGPDDDITIALDAYSTTLGNTQFVTVVSIFYSDGLVALFVRELLVNNAF
jgi:hypothetical protein